jgi:hypothetical protein
MNGSRPAVDLLQPDLYDCQTAAGRIAWDPRSSTLTVDGTIFFDERNQPLRAARITPSRNADRLGRDARGLEDTYSG